MRVTFWWEKRIYGHKFKPLVCYIIADAAWTLLNGLAYAKTKQDFNILTDHVIEKLKHL